MATKKKALKKKTAINPKLERWKKKGEALARAKWSNQWAIAAWMCKGEDGFKKPAYEAAEKATGMTVETLRQFAYTARHVSASTRVNGLSFGHHRLVAPYTREKQARFLKHAKDNGESVEAFAAWLKALRKDATLETRSPADTAASKVIEACAFLLRSEHFDTLLAERPSAKVRTEVLDRLNEAIHTLSNKVEELEAEWCVKAKGTGAGQ